MRQIITGGTVVTGSGSFQADVLIDGEKIAAIGSGEEIRKLAAGGGEKTEAAKTDVVSVTDASGCLLFPGFIDAHTHFDLHVAGTVTADDFYTGTKAAIRGGTTTIVDFGTQYPGETLQEGLDNWHKKADGKCSCDYGFHMSITDWNPAVSQEINRMIQAGVTSFKLYMTYDTQVDDKTIYEILKRLKEVKGIAGVHCENSGVIAALQESAAADGKMGVSSHPATRPASAEAEAIQRLLRLAEIAGAPVVVVHLTCQEGLKEITAARARGQEVYVETCPQYLLMNDSLYQLPGFEGAKYVIAPPLRKEADEEALWKALKCGAIQTVSTDHCSFTTKQKELGIQDFRKIPGGMPGVETRGILMYSEGVCTGRLTREEMCRLLSENPAKLYGMYPRKGVIAPGSDADIVILNPNAEDVITAADQLSNVDYAPFEGLTVKGRVETVFLRGQKVVEHHQVVKELCGCYIARRTYEM
ncbi:MAG: dihydropyrimidinase [Lachnospiraceae bacterium]|nr:dihydropyrimidinase [Lachnospiraceae bacterium]